MSPDEQILRVESDLIFPTGRMAPRGRAEKEEDEDGGKQ